MVNDLFSSQVKCLTLRLAVCRYLNLKVSITLNLIHLKGFLRAPLTAIIRPVSLTATLSLMYLRDIYILYMFNCRPYLHLELNWIKGFPYHLKQIVPAHFTIRTGQNTKVVLVTKLQTSFYRNLFTNCDCTACS